MELAEHLQMYRGDNVKDDTGCQAVLTEQGASASQMTAAKVLDTISRLLGMAWEANDAVSAFSQVKMTDVPRLLKQPETERTSFGIILQGVVDQVNGTRSMTQWFFWKAIGTRHPLAGFLSKTVKSWECFYFHRVDQLFFCVRRWHQDDGSERKLSSDVGKIAKKIEHDAPTPIVHHVDLWCARTAATVDEGTIRTQTEMFQIFFTLDVAGTPQHVRGDSGLKVLSWSRTFNSVSHLKQLGTPCIDDWRLKNDDFEVVGELALVCVRIVLNE